MVYAKGQPLLHQEKPTSTLNQRVIYHMIRSKSQGPSRNIDGKFPVTKKIEMFKNTQLLATFLISIILIGCTVTQNSPKLPPCEDTIACLEATFSQEIISDPDKQDFLLFNNGRPIGLVIEIGIDCVKNIPDHITGPDPQRIEELKEMLTNAIIPRLQKARVFSESSDYSDYLHLNLQLAGSVPSPGSYLILVFEFKKTFSNPDKPEMSETLTSWRRLKAFYAPNTDYLEALDNLKKTLLNLSDEFLVEFLGVNATGDSQ